LQNFILIIKLTHRHYQNTKAFSYEMHCDLGYKKDAAMPRTKKIGEDNTEAVQL
jgi:hypothetical protein